MTSMRRVTEDGVTPAVPPSTPAPALEQHWYDLLEKLIPVSDLVILVGGALLVSATGALLGWRYALGLAGVLLIVLGYALGRAQ